MLTRILAFAALCTSLGLAADDTTSIAGQVLNSVTQAPAKGARLYLRRAGRDKVAYTAVTNTEGRFVVNDIAPGGYRLDAECDGYDNQGYGRGRKRVLTLLAGQSKTDIVFRLVPYASISGRIVDEEGIPKAGATLMLRIVSFSGGADEPTFTPGGFASTNDLGEYSIYKVKPGRYVLLAESTTRPVEWEPGAKPNPDVSKSGYSLTFFPNAPEAASAARIDVAPGAQLRGMDITLHTCPLVRVRGKVLPAPSGAARRQGGIMLHRRDAVSFHALSADFAEGGRFEFPAVPSGAYNMSVSYSLGEVEYRTRQPIAVAREDIEDLTVTMNPSTDIEGAVKVPGETLLDFSQLSVELRTTDGHDLFASNVSRGGTFTIRNVAPLPQRWTLTELPGNYFVRSVMLGDSNVTHSDRDLSQPVAAKLEFTLSPDVGEIQGVVTDEKSEPVEEATVVLVPNAELRSRTRLYRKVESDWQGRFVIHGIVPGDYKLLAWEQVKSGRWYDAGFMKPLESSGVEISIREKAKETRTLKAIPADAAK